MARGAASSSGRRRDPVAAGFDPASIPTAAVGPTAAMDDPLLLENQLCFPLYACAKGIVAKYKPFLDPLGLTYTQYIAMMVLWERKKLNVKALGAALLLDSGTLTPLLKKLEERGLVSRERSPEDERNLVVSITAKGERLKRRAALVPGRIGSCLGISLEEAKLLYSLLYKMIASVYP